MQPVPQASMPPAASFTRLWKPAAGGFILGALLAPVGSPALVGIVAAAIYIKIRSGYHFPLIKGILADGLVLTLCALVAVAGGAYRGGWTVARSWETWTLYPHGLIESFLGALFGTLLALLIAAVVTRGQRSPGRSQGR